MLIRLRYKVTLILNHNNIVLAGIVVIVNIVVIIIIIIIISSSIIIIIIIIPVSILTFPHIRVRTARGWVQCGRHVTCQPGLPWPCSA